MPLNPQPIPTPEAPAKKARVSIPLLAFILLVLGGLAYAGAAALGWVPVSGVRTSTNTKTYPAPSYIKDVVSYKEGSDGFVVYFVLADSNGGMTRSAGRAELTVTVDDSSAVTYTRSASVSVSDFQDTTAGVGAFEHDVVLASFGRITYSALTFPPSPIRDTFTIEVKFTTSGGKVLTGSDTIYLTK